MLYAIMIITSHTIIVIYLVSHYVHWRYTLSYRRLCNVHLFGASHKPLMHFEPDPGLVKHAAVQTDQPI